MASPAKLAEKRPLTTNPEIGMRDELENLIPKRRKVGNLRKGYGYMWTIDRIWGLCRK